MKNWDFNDSNADEKWDIYFKDRTKAGYTKRRCEQLKEYEYHLVVRTWIVNSSKEILLSQRGLKKRRPIALGMYSGFCYKRRTEY